MLNGRSDAKAPDDLDLPRLFDGLGAAPALLLAVSGGPDSMALLHLATRWRASTARAPELHVATVDHGLRPEAAAEAAAVAASAAGYGLPHATLAWTGSKPARGIQERAREARYRLLVAYARSIGAPFILTAHHADDQAETVLMRLGRGSGVAGLAAMRRSTPLASGITLVRPLLELTKRDLLVVCAAEGLAYVADPSNEDPTYHRVRLRRQTEVAAELGLDAPTLLRLARRMARADEALEAEVARRLIELQPFAEASRWRANLTLTPPAAPEIVQRLIGRAVRHVGKPEHLPLERLEVLAATLHAALGSQHAFRGTLGGTLLDLDDEGTLTVTPEPQRRRGRPRPD